MHITMALIRLYKQADLMETKLTQFNCMKDIKVCVDKN